MADFTNYAHQKMIELFNNHNHEVGSQLYNSNPEKYAKYRPTDCITYALNVISFAFTKVGNEQAAKKVWQVGAKGTELAKYLVHNHNWKGIYINPDSRHPIDGDQEHTYTSALVRKYCQYYQIPLEYNVIDYSVTSALDPNFQVLNTRLPKTKLNSVDIASLENVKFGFGISRGGRHTWVYSKGKVYEVHWESIGSGLYEASLLRNFEWLSGAIFIPLDQANHIATTAKLKCGA